MKNPTFILSAIAALTFSFATANPNPVANPNPDPVAQEGFYHAVQTSLAKREAAPEPIPVPNALQKRTYAPDFLTCGLVGAGASHGYTCKPGIGKPCCSDDGHCGNTTDHCAGGCQSAYGMCIAPTAQLSFDATDGDMIIDSLTEEELYSDVGDGVTYYGKTPPGGWPDPNW